MTTAPTTRPTLGQHGRPPRGALPRGLERLARPALIRRSTCGRTARRTFLPEFDEYCARARATADRMIAHVNAGRAGDKADPTLRELGLEGTGRVHRVRGPPRSGGPAAAHGRVRRRGPRSSSRAGRISRELPFMGKGWNAGQADGPHRAALGVAGHLEPLARRLHQHQPGPTGRRAADSGVGHRPGGPGGRMGSRARPAGGQPAGPRAATSPLTRTGPTTSCGPPARTTGASWSRTAAAARSRSASGSVARISCTSPRNHWLGNRGLAQLIFGGGLPPLPGADVHPHRAAHRVRARPR